MAFVVGCLLILQVDVYQLVFVVVVVVVVVLFCAMLFVCAVWWLCFYVCLHIVSFA